MITSILLMKMATRLFRLGSDFEAEIETSASDQLPGTSFFSSEVLFLDVSLLYIVASVKC